MKRKNLPEANEVSKAVIREKRGFTVNDACYYLGISRMSLYRLIQQEELRPFTVAGRTLLDKNDLDELISKAKNATSKKKN